MYSKLSLKASEILEQCAKNIMKFLWVIIFECSVTWLLEHFLDASPHLGKDKILAA